MQHFSQVNGLKVPVKRVELVIRTQRDRCNAMVFLPPETSPEELLEEDTPFFPAEVCGKVRLFARSAVTALTVEAEEDAPDSLLRLGIPFEKRVVAVHMQDGSTLMGLLTALHLHGRTLDLLNQPSRSFAIRTDDTVHHIAKAFVERIEEL